MRISIICPLYNGEKYIENLHKSLLSQKDVDICSIEYVLTRGDNGDKSEEILNKINATYKAINKEEFSHSTVREEAAYRAEGDIIVFISQDVIIKDPLWLFKLTDPIEKGECEASYSRQICDNNTIEKYIRENNYKSESKVVTKADIEKLGFITFFFSDAASAVKKDIFIKLKGYDGKRLVTNEDMYFAYKLIMAGYRKKYCADSEVIHSHTFTLKELYDRYYITGIFLQQNSYLLKYKSNEAGFALAKYVLKRALQERNFKVVFNIVPNFAARFIGSHRGKAVAKKIH